MDRTGTSFEIKTDTFTLENMFAMELHKYSNVIGDIVTSAVKELGIEKVSFRLLFSSVIVIYPKPSSKTFHTVGLCLCAFL